MKARYGLSPFSALALTLALLAGCGPRDIGTGTSPEPPPEGISTADQLRYPVYGAGATQRMLYLYSHPDITANMQQWRMRHFARVHGLAPVSPEDPQYRAVPRQASPFRQ
ncbi:MULTISPECIES: chemotaxis protein [unclassified Desulfovibrio]|uniref:chemotaxis protein n=1 Tax=unclassified Desulfovibrio TaxID=2593640 RepID=UPI000F5EBFBE|nr:MULTISPECIES: chemotaxis protein [unclassified Desulfovibrio]RRD70335.1 chemotaxis protein [Desulfovibrio sp. OH1209_COT-279]RRD86832.1 chemotaxis protein [Desulfovibrio sp. OH1186_COT-070]